MPEPADYLRVVAEQNPWQNNATVPPALAPPHERYLAKQLWQRLRHNEPRRYQVILGPRRAGKTTVLYQTVRRLLKNGIEPGRILWLRMDHPRLIGESLGDLVKLSLRGAAATPERPLYLMLDEIVYAADWDLWLKTFHDEHWPVRVAATSSSAMALRKQRRESGVGRWEEHHLLPCDLTEFAELLGTLQTEITMQAVTEAWAGDTASPAGESPSGLTLRKMLAALPTGHAPQAFPEQLWSLRTMVGGFPELVTTLHDWPTDGGVGQLERYVLESQRVLRSDAVERAVYKDIPQTAGVDNPLMLERLLYVLADQVTGILAPTRISKDLGVAQPTLDRYLSYLEQAYLVFTLTNYSGTEAGMQRRGRKLYFVDSAVRNAALHRGLAPLSDSVEQGILLENLVAATLHTLAAHAGVRLHYWRDADREVDLIYDDPQQPLAFEVASSPDHSRRGLEALIKRHPRFSGNSYLVAPRAAVIQPDDDSRGVGTLPLDTFLLAVGTQIRWAALVRLGFCRLERPTRRAGARLCI
ncbi:MAG: ATP-binding protein [Acidimicrobiaceae bacterium]|nr:ATP-binding protein [Acidimicrobiaceae bacterium]MCY4279497.1 ATP-binding protein [Acidimicrobiaceae bacterium]MCY4294479.1 ATP-binding protein [Acidimicrobiaceae bacterium]